MQDSPYKLEPAQLPTEVAFRKMRERIERDGSLAADIKQAVLDDLAGQTPARFPLLREALAPAENAHEADGAKSE